MEIKQEWSQVEKIAAQYSFGRSPESVEEKL